MHATARSVIGLGLIDALARAVPELPASRHQELAGRYRYHYLARDHELTLFDGVPAFEVLIQRILWSCAFLIVVVTLMRRWAALRRSFRSPRELVRGLGWSLGCALLIALNWGLYIYAVETHHVLQASLGYFMTPLVNVALGVVVLKERVAPTQRLAETGGGP